MPVSLENLIEVFMIVAGVIIVSIFIGLAYCWFTSDPYKEDNFEVKR
jgi:hypothetical protein